MAAWLVAVALLAACGGDPVTGAQPTPEDLQASESTTTEPSDMASATDEPSEGPTVPTEPEASDLPTTEQTAASGDVCALLAEYTDVGLVPILFGESATPGEVEQAFTRSLEILDEVAPQVPDDAAIGITAQRDFVAGAQEVYAGVGYDLSAFVADPSLYDQVPEFPDEEDSPLETYVLQQCPELSTEGEDDDDDNGAALLDACALLTDEQVAEVLGEGAVREGPTSQGFGPSNSQCEWRIANPEIGQSDALIFVTRWEEPAIYTQYVEAEGVEATPVEGLGDRAATFAGAIKATGGDSAGTTLMVLDGDEVVAVGLGLGGTGDGQQEPTTEQLVTLMTAVLAAR